MNALVVEKWSNDFTNTVKTTSYKGSHSDFESEGRRFESSWPHHKKPSKFLILIEKSKHRPSPLRKGDLLSDRNKSYLGEFGRAEVVEKLVESISMKCSIIENEIEKKTFRIPQNQIKKIDLCGGQLGFLRRLFFLSEGMLGQRSQDRTHKTLVGYIEGYPARRGPGSLNKSPLGCRGIIAPIFIKSNFRVTEDEGNKCLGSKAVG